MRKKKPIQFVSLPNSLCEDGKYTPIDLLVYLSLRSFASRERGVAWPAIRTIGLRVGLGSHATTKSLKKMEGDLFYSYTKGRSRCYVFPHITKGFEMFSFDFLKRTDISAYAKSYLVALQQYMFVNKKAGVGEVFYQTCDIAKLLNLNDDTLRRYEGELIRKGFLQKTVSDLEDPYSGRLLRVRRFNLKALGQDIVWKWKRNKDLKQFRGKIGPDPRHLPKRKPQKEEKTSLEQLSHSIAFNTEQEARLLEALRLGCQTMVKRRTNNS